MSHNFVDPLLADDPESHEPRRAPNTLTVREALATVLMVIMADITLLRGWGYSGAAAFVTLAGMIFLVGKSPKRHLISLWVLAAMIAAASLRLVWQGSVLTAIGGLLSVLAFATALDGRVPALQTVVGMVGQSLTAGAIAAITTLMSLRVRWRRYSTLASLEFLVPLVVLMLFGGLFILANPDVVDWLNQQIRILDEWSVWFLKHLLRPVDIVFWGGVAWITLGLLKPISFWSLRKDLFAEKAHGENAPAPMFVPWRNMLASVVALFAFYLVYEFSTLATKEFPQGFYYAGYAHQGAAWLTVALGLATLMLSLVFSGSVLNDPRLPTLRRWAWIWSVQNLLLAVAIYRRLFIYIDFNGMTRMRIVGLFGISLVVVGFLLVVWKIRSQKSFAWLVQRQIWALLMAVFLFSVSPIDGVVASTNVKRILNGEEAAVMPIAVQPLDLDGMLQLRPLLDSTNPQVREGVAALVAQRYQDLVRQERLAQEQGWRAYQRSRVHALSEFEKWRDHWAPFEDESRQLEAIENFERYGRQWY